MRVSFAEALASYTRLARSGESGVRAFVAHNAGTALAQTGWTADELRAEVSRRMWACIAENHKHQVWDRSSQTWTEAS